MKRSIFLILISLFLFTGAFSQQKFDTLSLSDVIGGKFFPKYVWGIKSMNDGIHYTSLAFTPKGMALIKYSYETGEPVDTLINFADIAIPWVGMKYQFSKDEKKVLFYTNAKYIYRRSFTANYFVYDLKKNEVTQVFDKPIRIATLSPNGNLVAFMKDNNLFIKNLKTQEVKQITTDGEKDKIINGAPDWVYEEEFSFVRAYTWSPNGRYLAYMKFDESRVPKYVLLKYSDDVTKSYPAYYTYKYPTAGEPNSKVTVHIYDLKSGKTLQVKIKIPYEYIPRIKWRPDGKYLAIETMNRHQDTLHLLYADPKTGKSFVAFTETNSKYIEDGFYDNLRFLPDKLMLVLSERDGWRHFFLYNWDGKFIKALNHGNWDVVSFVDYNPKTKTLYYKAAKHSPINREIYALNIETGQEQQISHDIGNPDITFSKTFKYYIYHFSNATTPPKYELYNSDGKLVRTLVDNSAILDSLAKYGNIHKTFFTFTTAHGVKLYAYKILPPDFDSTKKYPAVVMQYSGPASQTVVNRWDLGWGEYLASHGYVVFDVDTRGTDLRGEHFRKLTYLQLGKYESQDLADAGKYFASLNYIDGKHMAIWGWSYGGFMVLSVLTRHPDVYAAGIAVAPVTNWRYYDNIYTERYMRTPQENPDGYDQNSPLTYAGKLKAHLLIIHGLADDNVHPINTFQFTRLLDKAHKSYQMHIYTNLNHSLPGVYLQLFRMKTQFLNKYLKNQQ